MTATHTCSQLGLTRWSSAGTWSTTRWGVTMYTQAHATLLLHTTNCIAYLCCWHALLAVLKLCSAHLCFVTSRLPSGVASRHLGHVTDFQCAIMHCSCACQIIRLASTSCLKLLLLLTSRTKTLRPYSTLTSSSIHTCFQLNTHTATIVVT